MAQMHKASIFKVGKLLQVTVDVVFFAVGLVNSNLNLN